jgi:cytidylate kinase
VLENVKYRDHLDQTREESPLRKADDAITLDNSTMTRDEQNQWLLDLYNSIVAQQ